MVSPFRRIPRFCFLSDYQKGAWIRHGPRMSEEALQFAQEGI